RGHRVVDTDYGDWIEEAPTGDASTERLWRENQIAALLDAHETGALFVAGCVPNQGKFYSRFDAVVLLTAPREVILERIASRATNDYGKTEAERDLILRDMATTEPVLRAGATEEIDTRAPLGEVADALERIAGDAGPTSLEPGTRRARRASFEDVAELYDRARPSYPDVLFDDLVDL